MVISIRYPIALGIHIRVKGSREPNELITQHGDSSISAGVFGTDEFVGGRYLNEVICWRALTMNSPRPQRYK